MTLIVSVFSGTDFLAISDAAISVDRRMEGVATWMPMAFDPMDLSFAGHTVTGLAQKSVVITPTAMLQWTGRQVVADTVIRALRDAIAGGWTGHFRNWLGNLGLSDEELLSTKFILHRLNGGDMSRQTLQAFYAPALEGQFALVEGSGRWDFLEDTVPDLTGAKTSGSEGLINFWLTRMSSALSSEMESLLPLEHGYGGWFEITTADRDAFRKVPYCVKFWALHGGKFQSGPVYTNWYTPEGHLVIASAQKPGGVRRARTDITWIPHPLETPPTDNQKLLASFEPPQVQFHLVRTDGPKGIHFIRLNPWSGYRLGLEEGGLRERATTAVRRGVLKALAGEKPGLIQTSKPTQSFFRAVD